MNEICTKLFVALDQAVASNEVVLWDYLNSQIALRNEMRQRLLANNHSTGALGHSLGLAHWPNGSKRWLFMKQLMMDTLHSNEDDAPGRLSQLLDYMEDVLEQQETRLWELMDAEIELRSLIEEISRYRQTTVFEAKEEVKYFLHIHIL